MVSLLKYSPRSSFLFCIGGHHVKHSTLSPACCCSFPVSLVTVWVYFSSLELARQHSCGFVLITNGDGLQLQEGEAEVQGVKVEIEGQEASNANGC